MTELLSQLIEMLKQASPLLWETLVKQVRLTATLEFVWAGILLMAVFVLLGMIIYAKKAYDSDDYGFWYDSQDDYAPFYIGGIVIFGFIGVILVTSGIMHSYNPAYYAIKNLIGGLQ